MHVPYFSYGKFVHWRARDTWLPQAAAMEKGNSICKCDAQTFAHIYIKRLHRGMPWCGRAFYDECVNPLLFKNFDTPFLS
jgi:hypothetical protein